MELQVIQSKIYEIRGSRIMLDRDLAGMYGVETRRLNEQVKRNLKRFPDDFMFQLSEQEFQDWKSQFAISNSIKMGMRKRPYAFTELGVAMLSTVLNSDTAIEINMSIMRAFIAIRQFVLKPPVDRTGELQKEMREIKLYIDEMFTDQNDINEDTRMQIEIISQALAELQIEKQTEKPRRSIGF